MFDSVKKLFDLARDGNLAHGYILFGENDKELKETARAVAVFIEFGDEQASGTPIDLLSIDGRASGSIGIDSIRSIRDFLWRRPARSAKRTVVINNGEAMTEEAQNAILKISEDPPPHALILLTARGAEGLLPTIVSRFQKVHIARSAYASTNVRAASLSKQFLVVGRRERSAIIKNVTEKDDDGGDLTQPFLDDLIIELQKNKIKNSRLIRAILERKRLLGTYSLNKRLQLEFLSSLW